MGGASWRSVFLAVSRVGAEACRPAVEAELALGALWWGSAWSLCLAYRTHHREKGGPATRATQTAAHLLVEVGGTEWGLSPLLGEPLPFLAEVTGCSDVCPDVLPTPLLVMGGVRDTPALLQAYARSPSTSAPCLPTPTPTPTLFQGMLLRTESSPRLSPWQPERTRGCPLVPGPQATSVWEGPGGRREA